MAAPWLPSAIQGGSSVMSTGLNLLGQGQLNKKARKWSEKMYERQRNDALMDWAIQNHYNEPEQVMKRLKKAGLNPAMVYGGNNSTAAAQPIRQSSVEAWNPKWSDIDLGGVAQGALSYYDIELKKAQTDNVRQQTKVAMEDAALRAAQTIATTTDTRKKEIDTDQAAFNLKQAQALQGTVLESAAEGLRKLKAETAITLDRNEREAAMNASNLREAAERILTSRAQRAKTDDERKEIEARIDNLKKDARIKQLDIELKEKGIQPGDAIYWRVLSRLLMSSRQSVRNWFGLD